MCWREAAYTYSFCLMFKTDLPEHLAWGIFLCPFYCLLALDFSLDHFIADPLLIFHPSIIITIVHFIAGSVIPDLDLCLNPTTYPRVKKIVVSSTFACCVLCALTTGYFNIYTLLFSLWWSQLYIWIDLIQKVGLLLLIGIKPEGHHRQSAFHSITFWFSVGLLSNSLASLVLELDIEFSEFYAYFLKYALRTLASGAVAHIFLDHTGSMFQYNFTHFHTAMFLNTFFAVTVYESFYYNALLCKWVPELSVVRSSVVDGASRCQEELLILWSNK